MVDDPTRLNELDKDEWKDLIVKVRPDITDEQYDKMWENFVRFKIGKQEKRKIQ